LNVDATPFQAGTIVLIASRLRASGKYVDCPNHKGIYTANMEENESIGQEGKYNSAIANSLKSDDIRIANFASDGDSKGYIDVSKTQTSPGHLKAYWELNATRQQQGPL